MQSNNGSELPAEEHLDSDAIDMRDIMVSVGDISNRARSRQSSLSAHNRDPNIVVETFCDNQSELHENQVNNIQLDVGILEERKDGESDQGMVEPVQIDDLMIGIRNGTGVLTITGHGNGGLNYQTSGSVKVSENAFSTYNTPKFR